MSVSRKELMNTLFAGIEREHVDFTRIFEMGEEHFTHLGIACTCSYDHFAVGDNNS